MNLLPKDQWLLRAMGDHIAAGIYEHPPGCVHWRKIPIAELPNDLIEVGDLERFGIAVIDGAAFQEIEKASGGR